VALPSEMELPWPPEHQCVVSVVYKTYKGCMSMAMASEGEGADGDDGVAQEFTPYGGMSIGSCTCSFPHNYYFSFVREFSSLRSTVRSDMKMVRRG
jgi:hypothetical protein